MLLRKYQQEAIDCISAALQTHARVGAVMPTGSGKSLVETHVIDNICDNLKFNECCLVVCHITDVVEQLMGAYAKEGRFGKSAVRYTSRTKPRVTSKVVFSTMQSVISPRGQSYWLNDPMKKDVRYVVVDEAHQIGTDGYGIMIDTLFPTAKMVGLSATPFRKNQFSFGQFDHVAYAIDTQSLIDAKFLTAPRLFEMKLEGLPEHERFASICRIWEEKEKPRGLVSIVYLQSTAQAQELRLVFEERKAKVAFVDGTSGEAYCRDLYRRAREGGVEVIVNCKKLETGIDIPNIGAVFMPYQSKSVTSYLQRIGRALRLSSGKDFAHIYVSGTAPSVKEGQWSRLQRDALQAKDPLDPIENLVDDLEQLIEDSAPPERIAWTRSAISACEMLLGNDMRAVAELVAEKRFPQKYNRVILDLVGRMVKPTQNGTISEAQIRALTGRHSFRDQDVIKLGSGEAEAILKALDTFYKRDPFILQSGPHAGKHISETPPMYRRFIKDPGNRALMNRWFAAGKPGVS